MKSLYEDQKQEIDKAVVGIGEYKLSSPYLSYGVQAKDWFKKESEAMRLHFGSFWKGQIITSRS